MKIIAASSSGFSEIFRCDGYLRLEFFPDCSSSVDIFIYSNGQIGFYGREAFALDASQIEELLEIRKGFLENDFNEKG